jgi:hypothetical protein
MSTPTSKGKLDEVMKEAGPQELLRLAKSIRKSCVRKVANTELKLDPKALREMDGIINRMEAQLN